jgi:hypothetical protein
MLCHIHPPPGRSSRHRTAGLTDSRRDSRGAFCNSFTGDAFSGTLRFILAGRGTAGQSRRCEMAARMRRYPRHESARYGCLAETSRIFLPSRSGFKLTKISCDIGATRSDPFDPAAHWPATSSTRLKLHLKAWRAILTKPSTIEKEYAAVAQVVVPIPRPAEIWREGWPQRPLSSIP